MNTYQCKNVNDLLAGPASASLDRDFRVLEKERRYAEVIQNDLLTSLTPEDLEFLLPHLEFVDFPLDKQLFGFGEKLSYVYFPTSAVIALLYMLADGNMSEIAVVGHDGMVGMSAIMGETALGTALVQCPGQGYRLKASILNEACEHTEKMRDVLMRYTQILINQIAQNAVSGRLLSVDQQLSRWLLSRLDRLPGNAVKITQEVIASMLGVRRESISAAANRLQQQGLIQYRRGSITVLNRLGLEKYAGECYQVTRQSPEVAAGREELELI